MVEINFTGICVGTVALLLFLRNAFFLETVL